MRVSDPMANVGTRATGQQPRCGALDSRAQNHGSISMRTHLARAHFGDARVLEILKHPDAIYFSSGGSRRLVYKQGEDIVVVEGSGSAQGNVVTGYGPSGAKNESGARALGGNAQDPGEPITHEQITSETIPVAPRRPPIPPANQVWP